jgi:hypothetical protein
MKFNYPATILMGTVALASIFNAGQANAIECVTISVPWSWQLSQSGDSKALLEYGNTGLSFPNEPSQIDRLGGAFIVKLLFDEPSNYCEKRGNAPTATTLKIVGSFMGFTVSNLSPIITVPRDPASEGPFARASAFVDILGEFEPQLNFGGYKPFSPQPKITNRTVGDGSSISFAGKVETFATDRLSLAGISGVKASLDVTGEFTEATSGTVEYSIPVPESVPEPLTMLASATAVGFGAFFKRQHSKKSQKS